ncbi:hypothetical protein [Roseovarius sp.]|uniref:hypothetical protein n=1 Tax=Roseovarius sp. TaxID=1486281 RepID=UPI003A9701D9
MDAILASRTDVILIEDAHPELEAAFQSGCVPVGRAPIPFGLDLSLALSVICVIEGGADECVGGEFSEILRHSAS